MLQVITKIALSAPSEDAVRKIGGIEYFRNFFYAPLHDVLDLFRGQGSPGHAHKLPRGPAGLLRQFFLDRFAEDSFRLIETREIPGLQIRASARQQ